MFGNFYLMNFSWVLKLEKDWILILKILETFYIFLTNFKYNQNLLNKISHQFLVATKLYNGWNYRYQKKI